MKSNPLNYEPSCDDLIDLWGPMETLVSGSHPAGSRVQPSLDDAPLWTCGNKKLVRWITRSAASVYVSL